MLYNNNTIGKCISFLRSIRLFAAEYIFDLFQRTGGESLSGHHEKPRIPLDA